MTLTRHTGTLYVILLLLAIYAQVSTSSRDNQNTGRLLESADILTSAFSKLREDVSAWKQAPGGKIRFRRRTSVATEQTPEKTKKSKECRACETVMTTWREMFPCVGLAEPDWTPEIAIELPACPWVTTCSFFHEDERAGACTAMKDELKSKYEEVWSALQTAYAEIAKEESAEIPEGSLYPDNGANWKPPEVMRNNRKTAYYKACVELGRCEDSAVDCKTMLLGDTCRDNPSCPDAKSCDENCYQCYWVLRGWFPFFQSKGSDNEADGYGNCEGVPSAASFLELESSPQAVKGLGSPALVSGRGSPTLDDCMLIWDEVAKDPKARYLASYVSQLGSYDWNANTACRCLQKCEYDSYEAFDLFRACSYEPSDARVASLFPDLLIESSETDETARFKGRSERVYPASEGD